MLVRNEELADERGRVGKYYYVDYQVNELISPKTELVNKHHTSQPID